MNNSLFILAIFWGVWIIIPVIFDGLLDFIYMLFILIKTRKTRKIKETPCDKSKLPLVSIIIPTYNEEKNINECLSYLQIQNYPDEKMDIIVVDNGSTDKTSEIVNKHIQRIQENRANPAQNNQYLKTQLTINKHQYKLKKFIGSLKLITLEEQGKANALNAGIAQAQGEIIINIDSRSYLHPQAVYQMAKKFIDYPEYGAVTGNIEIDWDLVTEKDCQGQTILDKNGLFKCKRLTRKEKFLSKCQFMEYLTSFRLGRQFQDITGSMYTFSGAFTAFRRELVDGSALYKNRTVSEDTDLTLDFQRRNIRLGFAEKAKSYLKPVISFEKLYAQRTRWRRGQIEVVGLHLDWYANLFKGFWRNFWLGLLLMIDHTFAFPRVVWMFLLPLFFLFGYSMILIIEAIVLMYCFYVVMDFLNILYCYFVVDRATKEKIKDSIQYCYIMPLFRMITFFFRFGGYLEVIKEPQVWTTPYNPVKSIKEYQGNIHQRYRDGGSIKERIMNLIPGHQNKNKVYAEEKISELDSYGMEQKNNTNNQTVKQPTTDNSGTLNNQKSLEEKFAHDGGRKIDGIFHHQSQQNADPKKG